MNKSLNCNLCDYETNCSGNLKRHKANKHNIDVIWHHCDYCEYKCKHKSDLKGHKAFKHDIDVTWHHCDICDCKFKRKRELKRHKVFIHDIDVKWNYCNVDDCKFKSKTGSEIKRHKSYIHDIDVVWYHCDIGKCEKFFKDISDLKRHKLTCTGTDTILSYGEYRIKEMLDEMMVYYIHDKTHYPLTQFCGQPLRPDFLIEKDGYRPIMIEYHGIQHIKPKNFGSETEEQAYLNFLKQQEHDQIKRDFCKENDYHLVEIYYTDNSNIDLLVIDSLVKYHNWSDTDFF